MPLPKVNGRARPLALRAMFARRESDENRPSGSKVRRNCVKIVHQFFFSLPPESAGAPKKGAQGMPSPWTVCTTSNSQAQRSWRVPLGHRCASCTSTSQADGSVSSVQVSPAVVVPPKLRRPQAVDELTCQGTLAPQVPGDPRTFFSRGKKCEKTL